MGLAALTTQRTSRHLRVHGRHSDDKGEDDDFTAEDPGGQAGPGDAWGEALCKSVHSPHQGLVGASEQVPR